MSKLWENVNCVVLFICLRYVRLVVAAASKDDNLDEYQLGNKKGVAVK